MLLKSGEHHIVKPHESLPELPARIENLYLDFETTSRDRTSDSLRPWGKCNIAGICITWDNHPTAYYIPIEHHLDDGNYSRQAAFKWLLTLLMRSIRWVNANPKYDMHVLCKAGKEHGVDFDKAIRRLNVLDILTRAKLVDSDRWHYSEESLARDWLGKETSGWKHQFKAILNGSKDWGELPIHVMGPYGCEDVLVARDLHRYIDTHLPESCREVADTEEKLTSCLYDVEQSGIRIDPQQVQIAQLKAAYEMKTITDMMAKEHGRPIRPHTNQDCFELFHDHYKLPVVAYTDTVDKQTGMGQPSYNKAALKTLMRYPQAPKELLRLTMRYRHLSQLYSLYLEPYMKLHVDGILHSDYNQCVRTGRMSCRLPNAQQLSSEAKELILPHEDHVFLSLDYSSVEFRILAHYLNQPEILEAFASNPDQDFHQWVADMCGIGRSAAKNVNFCMAYGGGKRKVLSMLAANDDIIKDIKAADNDQFQALCLLRASEVFNTYHKVLWRLKGLTNTASNRVRVRAREDQRRWEYEQRARWEAEGATEDDRRQAMAAYTPRGYVANLHGRRRRLPVKACYRGLNTVIQSEAADVMKEAAVMLSPRFNARLAAEGVKMIGLVHDELLFSVPREALTADLAGYILKTMLAPSARYDVPLTASVKSSASTWKNLENFPYSTV